MKLNPNWIDEKIAFFTFVPTAGDCGPAGIKVYRRYSNGMTGAPNHRFTTSPTFYDLFTTTLGWAPEGVRFCTLPLVSVAACRGGSPRSGARRIPGSFRGAPT